MAKVVVVVASVVALGLGGHALAGPTVRFGLTGAIADQTAIDKHVMGPAIGIGLRAGPFVGEVEWAYLSFFDPDTTSGGVHRLGVALRADVLRTLGTHCLFRTGCTRAQSLWLEVGAGERLGQWQLDAAHVAPASSHVPEAHLSLGLEIDNQIYPMRNGFQVGVRLAVAPRGSGAMSACRGSGCVTPTSTTGDLGNHGGYDSSVLVEWMFLFGG
jgi:hypothetical protein